jgi:hypothetical protein
MGYTKKLMSKAKDLLFAKEANRVRNVHDYAYRLFGITAAAQQLAGASATVQNSSHHAGLDLDFSTLPKPTGGNNNLNRGGKNMKRSSSSSVMIIENLLNSKLSTDEKDLLLEYQFHQNIKF